MKKFIIFVGIFQFIVIIGHVAIYGALLFLFPSVRIHQTGLLIATGVLCFSFLTISLINFKFEHVLIRWSYILSALWMSCFVYLLSASIVGVLFALAFPPFKVILGEVLFTAATLITIYGIINARILRTVTIKISLPNLPLYWKGKTAVMISDLHLGHVLRNGFAKKVINKISSLKPEVVFISGDFFDSSKTDFHHLAQEFKALISKQGIYYASGNHEQIAGYEICEQAIASAGIHILENEKVDIEGLQILGLAYYAESQETPEHIKNILDSMNIDPTKPSILLKHVPKHPQVMAQAGIALELCGHTHHGQQWPMRFITRKVYKGFDYGLQKLGKFHIYTSSGVGTWGPPVRVFTKSEIVKIIFE